MWWFCSFSILAAPYCVRAIMESYTSRAYYYGIQTIITTRCRHYISVYLNPLFGVFALMKVFGTFQILGFSILHSTKSWSIRVIHSAQSISCDFVEVIMSNDLLHIELVLYGVHWLLWILLIVNEVVLWIFSLPIFAIYFELWTQLWIIVQYCKLLQLMNYGTVKYWDRPFKFRLKSSYF